MRLFVNCIHLESYLYTLSRLYILLAAGPFQKLNILWYAENSQWVQSSTFFNEKFIFPYSFLVKKT